MKLHLIQRPICGTRHRFVLAPHHAYHLRQCPDCYRWMVIHTDNIDSEDVYRADSFDHLPTCPVNGCHHAVQPQRQPRHIIENHEGSVFEDDFENYKRENA